MSFVYSLVEALAEHLRANVAGIAKVYEGWPNKNQALTYPSISLTAGEPRYVRCAPYLFAAGVVSGSEAVNKYIVGQYDLALQLDIWTRYKPERDAFLDKVFSVLQPVDAKGFVIRLPGYHNVYASLSLTGHSYPDGEGAATLEEWRAILSLEATGQAVQSQTDYIITQEPVLTFETQEKIEE